MDVRSKSDMSDTWIATSTAVKLLGVSRQRINTLIHEGRIRAIKLGPKRVQLNLRDVMLYKNHREAYFESVKDPDKLASIKDGGKFLKNVGSRGQEEGEEEQET